MMDIEGATFEQVTSSGYELLERLFRRKQYVRSHVRHKAPLVGLDQERSFFQSPDMQVDGYGLMERTSIDPRRPKSLPWFEDGRTTYQHHADYLKRLSKLRDELVEQEQANLVNALERLRQRQFGKENIYGRANRLKDTSSQLSDGSSRKSFVTTLEHFQRTRPRKSPPRIMPLEGKQILEPQSYFSRTPQYSEKSPSISSNSSSKNAEESFRLNLQRLIQPTSSIPNIGRKSTSSSKQLVLESSPIQKRSSNSKGSPTFFQERPGNAFKGVHKGGRLRQLMKPDSDELDLAPNSVQFDHSTDVDKFYDDNAKEYCIYYLPTNTPTAQNMEDEPQWYDDSLSDDKKFDRERKKRLQAVEGKAIRKNDGSKASKTHRKTPRKNELNNHHDSEVYCDSPALSVRKQIVVDMPSIVFNSATPEKIYTDFEAQHSDLRKTYKQNELRSRELKNLIEDVKELNIRSDTLTENIMNYRPKK